MGLDMFLFSIQKGKEKYLVDDKYITQLPLSESYGLTAGFIFMPVGVRYEDQIKLGGDLCPYNLVIPNCKNPDNITNFYIIGQSVMLFIDGSLKMFRMVLMTVLGIAFP